MTIARWINRAGSFVVSFIYLGIYVYYSGIKNGLIELFGILILVVSLIWFGDYWGQSRPGNMYQGMFYNPTPGWMVCGMGWFILIGIPIIGYYLQVK